MRCTYMSNSHVLVDYRETGRVRVRVSLHILAKLLIVSIMSVGRASQ